MGHGREPEIVAQRPAGAERGKDRQHLHHRGERRDTVPRHRRMGRSAGVDEPHPARRAVHGSRAKRDLPERQTRQIVKRQSVIRTDACKLGIRDHAGRALARLLRRLEQEHDTAPRWAPGGQSACHEGKDRAVAVMAAKVADAVPLRAMGPVADLEDGKRVEFGAQEHGRSVLRPFEHRRHAVAAETGQQGIRSAVTQEALNHPGRPGLLVRNSGWACSRCRSATISAVRASGFGMVVGLAGYGGEPRQAGPETKDAAPLHGRNGTAWKSCVARQRAASARRPCAVLTWTSPSPSERRPRRSRRP